MRTPSSVGFKRDSPEHPTPGGRARVVTEAIRAIENVVVAEDVPGS